ncbi:hypothetical protein CPC08DRAFT_713919 [Agrocybe pediades]|nr:hypothetical protein CPC08DRAFT_713919 [Agrocybe pediades]
MFRVELGEEDGLSEHASGHLVIDGDLGNLYSSPRLVCSSFILLLDPLFFLHDANLDRLWWR